MVQVVGLPEVVVEDYKKLNTAAHLLVQVVKVEELLEVSLRLLEEQLELPTQEVVEVVVAGMVTWLILVFLAGQGVPE